MVERLVGVRKERYWEELESDGEGMGNEKQQGLESGGEGVVGM